MYTAKYLSDEETAQVQQLIDELDGEELTLQRLWQLMDLVWDEMGCDNTSPDTEKFRRYYQHPVWLLNGLFIESHDVSLTCRSAISDWIVKRKLTKVLDFGGGFGTLARTIAAQSFQTTVDIYEPFPTDAAQKSCQGYKNITFVSQPMPGYDCLVCTDILEHVSDPLALLANMIELVQINGYLIIANHFHPSIKCHLPETFHLRFSFDQLAIAMGLQVIGFCQGSHATIYLKVSKQSLNWPKLRQIEAQSKRLFVLREFNRRYVSIWKVRVKKLLINFADACRQVLFKTRSTP
ncbi:hypothetical protein C8255_12505 [filamentous cyanobacterium CCP3]|nr:hypothetical protein C8255_12505 [filamentous cyanobacterium CCP3]